MSCLKTYSYLNNLLGWNIGNLIYGTTLSLSSNILKENFLSNKVLRLALLLSHRKLPSMLPVVDSRIYLKSKLTVIAYGYARRFILNDALVPL